MYNPDAAGGLQDFVSQTNLNNKTRDRDNKQSSSWYEAMARAWGSVLDKQANTVENLSNALGNDGKDRPSDLMILSVESARMSIMANAAQNSVDSIGDSLETLGKKQ